MEHEIEKKIRDLKEFIKQKTDQGTANYLGKELRELCGMVETEALRIHDVVGRREQLRKQCTLYSVIKRYFTEPFEDYDGNWKGIIYYEKMRMRKEWIKFCVIMIFIITGVIILNVL